MRRKGTILVVAVVIQCCSQFISAASEYDNNGGYGGDFWDNDFDVYANQYVDWNKYARQNLMDVDEMVADIIKGIDSPPSMNAFDKDFGSNLEDSIQKTIQKSMDGMKDLQKQITMETEKLQKKNAKEQSIILDGRNGVTLLEIEGLSKPKKQYLIKDGKWYTCKEQLSNTAEPNCANLIDATPDICAFNSIVKYTINRDPNNPIYKENDVVCLIKGNSNSVRQFSGVPEKTVKDTCGKGDILAMTDYISQCGEQQKLHYNFWPSSNTSKACGGRKFCSLKINWNITSQGVSQSTSDQDSSGNDSTSVVSSSFGSFS